MKAAVIQLSAGTDKKKNIEKAVWRVKEAIKRRARFILLPEVFIYRGKISGQGHLNTLAEDIPGESIQPLMELAGKHKVFILAGSLYERIKGTKKVYNTSVFINDRGKIGASTARFIFLRLILEREEF